MRWVTWENVGIDRMASAWLIRQYIDTDAEFSFIPQGNRDIPEGTTPFDIPGARFSHHLGHCTFHTLLRAFDLRDPILDRMAEIIDGADVPGSISLAIESAGVDMICRGLQKVLPSDAARLETGALICAALHAQIQTELEQT